MPGHATGPALLLVALGSIDLGTRLPLAGARALVVLPPAFLAPGAAACCALCGPAQPLRGLSRITLWVMMSLAIYPLLALLLQLGGYPITAANALRCVNALVLLLLAVCSLRIALLEHAAALHGRPAAIRPLGEDTPGFWQRAHGMLVIVAPVLGIAPVVAGALLLLPKAPPTPYSQVALDGPWAQLHSVARGTDGQLRVRVRITNQTGHPLIYHIDPSIESEQWAELVVPLASGTSWSGTVSGTVPSDGALHRLRIAVHVPDERGVKALTIWVQSAAPRTRRTNPHGIAPARARHGAILPATIPSGRTVLGAASDDQPPSARDRVQWAGRRR